MTDSKNYKHIKIGSAQNDEVVIKAGKSSTDESTVASSGIDDTPTSCSVSDPAAQNIEKANNATNRTSDSDPSYSSTTLDDLESSKMSWTQIVVIGVALIALASFIIWYIVFS